MINATLNLRQNVWLFVAKGRSYASNPTIFEASLELHDVLMYIIDLVIDVQQNTMGQLILLDLRPCDWVFSFFTVPQALNNMM